MARSQKVFRQRTSRRLKAILPVSGELSILGTIANISCNAAMDQDVEAVTDMFAGLNKKKKKSTKKPTAADEEVAPDATAADGDAATFDASAMKKKKKKAKPKAADAGDFDAKLAEAGVGDEDGAATTNGATTAQEGDMEKGTGIWAHEATTQISYPLLLTRFFALVNQYNPDILSSGSRSYKIPPPQCLREGNKKTIFANIAEICKRMKRNDEHVTQFLFAELGTSGSVDGNRRLVIKGRFQQKQIENVLRRYIGKPSSPLSCTCEKKGTVANLPRLGLQSNM